MCCVDIDFELNMINSTSAHLSVLFVFLQRWTSKEGSRVDDKQHGDRPYWSLLADKTKQTHSHSNIFA